MTLEELQAEFPHGSRWRAEPHVRVVLGWDPGYGLGSIVYRTEGFADSIGKQVVGMCRRDWQRIPDPIPCPITEPVALIRSSNGYIGIKGFATDDPGEVGITLHPDGRWTWEGGRE